MIRDKQNLLFLFSFVIALTGCGTQKQGASSSQRTATITDFSDVATVSNPTISNSIPSGGTGSSSPTPTPSPTPISNRAPAYEYNFSHTGYDGDITFQVPARNVLKVKFQPDVAQEPVAGTGFVPRYTQLAVFMQVGTLEKATPLLSNGLLSDQQSYVIDFSAQINSSCPSSNTACRSTVTVTVRKPNYDYWYYNYGIPGCTPDGRICQPYSHVEDTHNWRGKLIIQTDDTNSL